MNTLRQFLDFFASVRLAIFTLSSLAVTSIIGTIIPQNEPSAFYVQKYGTKTAQFMDILDIQDMYSSWWFTALLALLCINLIVCSLNRLPRVLKLIREDNLSISPDRIFRMSSCRELLQPQVSSKYIISQVGLSTFLKQSGWSSTSRSGADFSILFSQKGKWSRLGVYLVHLSILIIMAGAVLGSWQGFKGSVMIPELRATDRIFSFQDSEPIDLGFQVRNNAFDIEFYKNGMPKEYRSNLTIIEDNQEVMTREIEVNKPLSYKGITFYQASYQPYQDFIITISAPDEEKEHNISIGFQKQHFWEEKQLRFGIVNADAIGKNVSRIKFWFKDGHNPATIQWLNHNEKTVLESDLKQYQITVKQRFGTGLQVSKDPGVWIVYFGCALMLLGLYMAFFLSHRRIWLLQKEENNSVRCFLAGSSNKNKSGFARELDTLQNKFVKFTDRHQ